MTTLNCNAATQKPCTVDPIDYLRERKPLVPSEFADAKVERLGDNRVRVTLRNKDAFLDRNFGPQAANRERVGVIFSTGSATFSPDVLIAYPTAEERASTSRYEGAVWSSRKEGDWDIHTLDFFTPYPDRPMLVFMDFPAMFHGNLQTPISSHE